MQFIPSAITITLINSTKDQQAEQRSLMGQLSYWHSVEISAGDRPTLRENEIDILVEDSVGLYQGKSKILQRQNGRLYLTSQRLIYVDNSSPKELSLSLDLSDLRFIDYTAKFLKSSPKITVFFKSLKHSHPRSQSKNQNTQKSSTTRTTIWICPICTFSNDVSISINFSNAQFLPSCQTCGVKADQDTIKTAVDSARVNNNDTTRNPLILTGTNPATISTTEGNNTPKRIECAACTFLNHPSMRNCEICGTALPMNALNELTSGEQEIFDDRIKVVTEMDDGLSEVKIPFMKLSFHKGGDKVFFQRLQQTMEKLEWETLTKRGNVNINGMKAKSQNNDGAAPTHSDSSSPSRPSSSMAVGLHRLTQMEADQTKKNEEIINSSLDDLQTLLAKAHEIQDLIESFKRLQTGDDRVQAKIIPTINQVTEEILSDPSRERQKKFYLQEVSRQISEFLINNGTLEQEGGIITLMDLYALYNRGRVGFNLISPDQLYVACTYFAYLKLPLILKKINKVLVVQDIKFQNNQQLIEELVKFVQIYGIDDQFHFKYAQLLRVSEFFNWSLSITEEILKIGIESGALCVDQQVTGKNYYLNQFMILEEQTEVNYDNHDAIQDYKGDGNDSMAVLLKTGNEKEDEVPVESQPNHSVDILNDLFHTNAPSTLLPTALPDVPSTTPGSAPSPAKMQPSRTLMDLEGLQF